VFKGLNTKRNIILSSTASPQSLCQLSWLKHVAPTTSPSWYD